MNDKAMTATSLRMPDGLLRQFFAGVQGDQLGIVPFGDGAAEDVRCGIAIQFQVAGLEAGQVHDDGGAADHGANDEVKSFVVCYHFYASQDEQVRMSRTRAWAGFVERW